MRYTLLFLLFLISTRESMAAATDEKYVAGGDYYVGPVFGQHDYAAHANVKVKPFFIMATEVTYASWQAVYRWALAQGYQFDDGCNGANGQDDCLPPVKDRGLHPVTNIEWLDAVIFANALSEKSHLQPVYRLSNGQPLRSKAQAGEFHPDPDASGYRLPTLDEWHIAARGGKPALDAGTYGVSEVARLEDITPRRDDDNIGTHPVAGGAANALGLYDMSGNVAEWVFDSELYGHIKMYYFCGGSYVSQTRSVNSCDYHSAGFVRPDIGFRLVRSEVGA